MSESDKLLIIGGGLAGIGTAYWCKRQNPDLDVVLLEKEVTLLPWTSRKSLGEVPVGKLMESPALVEGDYPRGWTYAGSVLERWPASSTRDWLEGIGLTLKIHESGTLSVGSGDQLASGLEKALRNTGVRIRTGYAVESVSPQPDGSFRVWSREGDPEACRRLLIATGGERNHGMTLARELGSETAACLPAFVRLKLVNPNWGEQFGPMERTIRLKCPKTGREAAGTATLSARGLEGEAVSGLSCQLCTDWNQRGYRLQLEIDWVPEATTSGVRSELSTRCLGGRKKPIGKEPLFGFTERQWLAMLSMCRIDPETPWLRLKARKMQILVQRLKGQLVAFEGMGLPTGERAWAGGVSPETMNWRTCQSLSDPGLYFAGETLDILGMPGGSNLNLVWATAHLAGSSLALEGEG